MEKGLITPEPWSSGTPVPEEEGACPQTPNIDNTTAHSGTPIEDHNLTGEGQSIQGTLSPRTLSNLVAELPDPGPWPG